VKILRKKSIGQLQLEARQSTGLKRVLGLGSLTAIGLGGIIGVGALVLTGTVAAKDAGPAVLLSFILAGLASAAAALCYAEFAGLIPVAGSAYTYSYAVLGEFAAWVIGWDLLLEYAMVVGVVAIGWSGYLDSILDLFGIQLPQWAKGAPGTGPGHVVNLVAVIVSLGISVILTFGIKWGSRFNNAMVLIKVGIILFIIAVGAFYVDIDHWTPFMPFGFEGVVTGAAIVFFAVFGYDTLTTAAEEAKNPQRDLPRAVIYSLGIALTLYVAFALVLTGMMPYSQLDDPAPVAKAFNSVGLKWATLIVSIAAVTGILSVLFAFMLGAARIWFAMSRDGLLPAWFAKIHPKYGTPYRPTLLLGVITALASGFTPIKELAELVNIGTLSAFILICAAVWVLRVKQPDLPRTFRTPLVPWLPLIGIIFSIWLIISLPAVTWLRFAIWLIVGVVLYFVYGKNHSRLNHEEQTK
jgi:APA family basic amino acid/polyamine antiporter